MITENSKIDWSPRFFADIDETEEDSDYLRRQECCASCGAYTGDLPGYYWTEDDNCPTCRNQHGEEKWSEEVERIMIREKLDPDEIKSTMDALNEYNGI